MEVELHRTRFFVPRDFCVDWIRRLSGFLTRDRSRTGIFFFVAVFLLVLFFLAVLLLSVGIRPGLLSDPMRRQNSQRKDNGGSQPHKQTLNWKHIHATSHTLSNGPHHQTSTSAAMNCATHRESPEGPNRKFVLLSTEQRSSPALADFCRQENLSIMIRPSG
jgi:hypothetical protein